MGQISIQLNGAPHQTQAKTVDDLIQACELTNHVIVELNQTILKPHEFKTTPINQNDTIEMIQYVGGGSDL